MVISKRHGCLLLAGAVFAAYANVYGNAFVLDDVPLIVENAFLRGWDKLPDLLTGLTNAGAGREGGFYRPLQMLLYFFTFQLFGLSAAAFHFINIALHAANAGLVYLLGCRLNFRRGAAFAAALLWSLHPLFTEAVAFVSGTADPLSVFFGLCGILLLLPDFSPRRLWLSLIPFALAIAAKESAVVFPLLGIVTFFFLSPDRLVSRAYQRLWPLAGMIAGYLMVWTAFGGHGLSAYDPRDVTDPALYTDHLFNRILTSLATLPEYLRLLLWPAGLHMERSYPVFTDLSWQVLAGVAMVLAALVRIYKNPAHPLSWGLLWFAVGFAPVSGILLPVNAIVSEHWLYLPAIGLFLGVAESINIRHGAVIVAVLALALGVKTHVQNRIWHDPGSFYENILAQGVSTGRIHNNLGLYYWQQGDVDRAIAHLRIAVDDPGVRMEPLRAGMHVNLALMYLGAHVDAAGMVMLPEIERALSDRPHIPEAVAELNRALAIDPDFYWAQQVLTVIGKHRKPSRK